MAKFYVNENNHPYVEEYAVYHIPSDTYRKYPTFKQAAMAARHLKKTTNGDNVRIMYLWTPVSILHVCNGCGVVIDAPKDSMVTMNGVNYCDECVDDAEVNL